MSKLIVAIDGPSASGKSTVSRTVAAALGCVYVDSGSYYRGLTWKVLQAGVSPQDGECVVRVMRAMRMELFLESGGVRFRIDEVDPGQAIRSNAVRESVSAVAAIPEVRDWMVELFRGMTRFGGIVMEGRDIGTVVFPETPHKFYLDADPAERARRRCQELQQQEGRAVIDDVLQSLSRRDTRDSQRAAAPLRVAADAVVIESTAMSIDDVVATIVKRVRDGKGA